MQSFSTCCSSGETGMSAFPFVTVYRFCMFSNITIISLSHCNMLLASILNNNDNSCTRFTVKIKLSTHNKNRWHQHDFIKTHNCGHIGENHTHKAVLSISIFVIFFFEYKHLLAYCYSTGQIENPEHFFCC